jgi:hypothetical protein
MGFKIIILKLPIPSKIIRVRLRGPISGLFHRVLFYLLRARTGVIYWYILIAVFTHGSSHCLMVSIT